MRYGKHYARPAERRYTQRAQEYCNRGYHLGGVSRAFPGGRSEFIAAFNARDFDGMANAEDRRNKINLPIGDVGYGAFTPLQKAAEAGDLEMVRFLVEHGADVNLPNYSPLIPATDNGQFYVVDYLIQQGSDINAANNLGRTLLMQAAYRGLVDVVDRLIAAGVDVNLRDRNGDSAFFWSISHGNVDVVDRLLNAGADIQVRDKLGKTTLQRAVKRSSLPIVDRLIMYGVDVNARDLDGSTALMDAAVRPVPDQYVILERLINSGAMLDLADQRGWTALMKAASMGNVEGVRLLLEAGADPWIVDNSGRNAQTLATQFVSNLTTRNQITELLNNAVPKVKNLSYFGSCYCG